MASSVLFVISAPSGGGKTTLISRLRVLFPDMAYSVSCTTRPPREGEVDGEDYYFLDSHRFRQMIKEGEFLEWKEVHGNLYGSPAGPVRECLESGQPMIMDIDVEGAKEVFRNMPDAVGLFVSPPDMTVLEERLRGRGTDSEEVINRRIKNAKDELAAAKLFKYEVVNRDLEETVDQLAAIIRKELTRGRGPIQGPSQ
ncbi:MAG: guanylate kinase [Thermodesulfobacteriota bacterium]